MVDEDESCQSTSFLVAAAQHGDHVAFDTLFEQYRLPLTRYLIPRCGEPELAFDVSQDTFVNAFRHLSSLRQTDSFASWLFQIAHHLLWAEFQRRISHPNVSLQLLTSDRESSLDAGYDLQESLSDRQEITDILSCLPALLRQALVWNCVSGYTAKEIAAKTGITPAAAERRISRAKAAFRLRYLDTDGG